MNNFVQFSKLSNDDKNKYLNGLTEDFSGNKIQKDKKILKKCINETISYLYVNINNLKEGSELYLRAKGNKFNSVDMNSVYKTAMYKYMAKTL